MQDTLTRSETSLIEVLKFSARTHFQFGPNAVQMQPTISSEEMLFSLPNLVFEALAEESNRVLGRLLDEPPKSFGPFRSPTLRDPRTQSVMDAATGKGPTRVQSELRQLLQRARRVTGPGNPFTVTGQIERGSVNLINITIRVEASAVGKYVSFMMALGATAFAATMLRAFVEAYDVKDLIESNLPLIVENIENMPVNPDLFVTEFDAIRERDPEVMESYSGPLHSQSSQ